MTIKNVGFGGVTSSTYQNLGTVIQENAPQIFENQINQDSALLASKLLEEVDMDGEEYVVTLDGGNKASVAWVQDKGRLPVGQSTTPTKARFDPVYIVAKISLGMGASMAKLSGPQLITKLDEEMTETAANLGQMLGRGLHGGGTSPTAIGTWSGTAADSTVSLTFADTSIFRPGSAYDFIDTSASLSYVVRCTSITPGSFGGNSEDVAGTVAFINDVPSPVTGAVVALGATGVAVDDVFRLRGETAGFAGASATLSTAINSFDDIAGSGATASLGGVTAAAFPGWAGRYRNHNAAYSQDALVKFMRAIKVSSGLMPDVVVMSPLLAAAHIAAVGYQGAVFGQSAAASAARPMDVENGADKYALLAKGSGLRVGGADIVEDSNAPAGRITCYAKSKTKLAWLKKIGADAESGDPVLLGRDFFEKAVQLSGGAQLITHKRGSVGILDNHTGL